MLVFTLSDAYPWNSTYSANDGRVVYKVVSPYQFIGQKATIFRKSKLAEVDEQFGHLGVVKFNMVASSKFRFHGGEVKTKEYFRLGKRGWNGRDHIFTAPDGREYTWVLGADAPILYLNDSPSIVVARYRRKWDLSWPTPPARLEIMPAGEGIVDTIVMTLVFIEHLRLARERAKEH
ncbi:hypothetical protein BDN72DRAFT_776285 [Pluteus cervinus]|uniref:Uncharacterized protein n=1 Tax=Pluteus cervinus TaxID=181527 RepID=A0ACD3AB56_9AGAR|nr:hypothetical protein BDN72DRAFT_776285 [Pluteus cervinus]